VVVALGVPLFAVIVMRGRLLRIPGWKRVLRWTLPGTAIAAAAVTAVAVVGVDTRFSSDRDPSVAAI
jgi:hypothetical protein